MISGKKRFRWKIVSTIPFLLSYLDTLLHIGFHAWISFEIAVDQFFGFLSVYVHSLCKAKYGDAVDDTEVGGFRLAAHVRVDVFQVYLIYFGSCCRMDIMIAEEGIDHIFVFAEMCHDTEFYLRIVGREEKTAFVRNECLADFFAVLVADRNILQVRVLELRRPVEVTVWLKDVCTRPVRGLISWGSASIYVPSSFFNPRCSSIFSTTGCLCRRLSSTSSEVTY